MLGMYRLFEITHEKRGWYQPPSSWVCSNDLVVCNGWSKHEALNNYRLALRHMESDKWFLSNPFVAFPDGVWR